MSAPILATKLYIPPPRPNLVPRPRLSQRLSAGLHGNLTLISAPAGFGKTTLVSAWVAECGQPVAWLSLDAGDNDPKRFLGYVVAALQTVAAKVGADALGESVLGALQSPQPTPPESILTALLNELAAVPQNFLLVLDDYHEIEAQSVNGALAFLLEHLPPQMHLVITTREDPPLPLARLRVRGQLTELRASDLRFTEAEAVEFINGMMGLDLAAEDVRALENRTEGWIAGLQLAALALQGTIAAGGQHAAGQSEPQRQDVADFIQSFSGSHRFVMDYLVEEVLHQQPEHVQRFLLRTSILDRLCGPLCDALLQDPAASGQETLAQLEQANLFIVPLDNERRWYRYHHLFADLLRQRLQQSLAAAPAEERVADLHIRASEWYEANGLELEAFRHATAADDVARAERLIEGGGMPLHFRGAVTPVLNWLQTLPHPVLDAHPSLWTAYASTLLASGQATAAEEKLQSAEAALQDAEPDEQTLDLIGRVAAIRSTSAAAQQQVETIIAQSQLALEYLHPDNLAFRTSTHWKLGYAYHLQGDRAAASRAYTQVISTGEASGNTLFAVMATIGLGGLQIAENQLHQAMETYQRALQFFGNRSLPVGSEAHLGLTRIYYEWNDLDAARQHGQRSIQLAQQYESSDRYVTCQTYLARVMLAEGDVAGATDVVTKAEQFARQHQLVRCMADVATTQVLVQLRRGDLAAAQAAVSQELPLSQARVQLAEGNAAAALDVLERARSQAEAKGWADDTLRAMVLQAVAHHVHGESELALHTLGTALAMAEPGGFVRLFVDEGAPMAQLLAQIAPQAAVHGVTSEYIGTLLEPLAAAQPAPIASAPPPIPPAAQPLAEPLSERELEVLHLVAQGLSNRQISERLFLALDTVKGHNRRIFGKLQVRRRTEAVARARELGLM